MKYTVLPEDHGLSLLVFLKKRGEKELSSNQIKKAIDSKGCKVNEKVQTFSSYQVMEGDVVELMLAQKVPAVLKGSFLFEDEYIAALNKPTGISSEKAELLKILPTRCKEWTLVHRLDKETSGVLLLAKSSEAASMMKELFSHRKVKKLYVAVVDGKVKGSSGEIDNMLGEKGRYSGQTIYGKVSKGGKRAVTHWRALKKRDDASLLLCDIQTGRTHQIRVHLSELGHPILGDHQYAKKTFTCHYAPERHLLHSYKISFTHPMTGKEEEIKAPLPGDFKKALDCLFYGFNYIN